MIHGCSRPSSSSKGIYITSRRASIVAIVPCLFHFSDPYPHYKNMSKKPIGSFSQLFPPKPTWTAENVPDQAGKTVIVTGGSNGIGKETVKVPFGIPQSFVFPSNRGSFADLQERSIGVAFEGRQSVHRCALRGEVTTGDRGTQARDGKRIRLLSQARPSGPRLRQGRRRGIHRKGNRAPHALQQRVSPDNVCDVSP